MADEARPDASHGQSSARARTDHRQEESLTTAVAEPAAPITPEQALAELARRELARRHCKKHPAHLLDYVKCVDSTTGETFQFQLLDETADWYWQREVLDEWIANSKSIDLKARQLGITWLAGGYGLWTILYTPGSKVLAVSIKEEEAVKLVNRVWDMLESLPRWLWNGAEVIKPQKARPTGEIQLRFPDGRVSTLRGLTSTPSAGHGETAALVILDEFSRQPYASETWKAVLPTTQGGGRVLVISTGNGVSSEDGDGGNFFHHLWTKAEEYGLAKRFLPWDLHPDRDEAWYASHAMALRTADRGEQYPRNELEAFILTGNPYFDLDAMTWYSENAIEKPKYRFDFREVESAVGEKARQHRSETGGVRVYRSPVEGRTYAIGADVATGRGMDYSAAYVVDLATMAIVAEFNRKLDADLFAVQLHYLGRWYNTALIAVETGGGYGDAIIAALRDGKGKRPPYPKLYRHVMSSRPDLAIAKPYGYPMNTHTRPLVINQLEKAIRERALPYLTDKLLSECRTFVEAPTNPSPRAQDGTNDDAVMSAAISLEMYRQKGAHPERVKRLANKKRRERPESMYPWQQPDRKRRKDKFDRRYKGEAAA